MVQASLEEFARTGNLGPICLGKSRDEVRAALGPPRSWLASEPVERSPIWKYGDVEFYFNDHDNLYGIHFDDGRRSWSGFRSAPTAT